MKILFKKKTLYFPDVNLAKQNKPVKSIILKKLKKSHSKIVNYKAPAYSSCYLSLQFMCELTKADTIISHFKAKS